MKTTDKEILLLIKALLETLEGEREEKKEVMEKLTTVLKGRKKDYLLPAVLRRLERAYLKKKKIELVFGRQQPKEVIEGVTAKLRQMLGEDKIIEVKIDKGIIGGFRVKTDKFLIKASVKDFLYDLH